MELQEDQGQEAGHARRGQQACRASCLANMGIVQVSLKNGTHI